MRDFIVKIALKLGLYKKFVDIDTFFTNRKKFNNYKKYCVESIFKL